MTTNPVPPKAPLDNETVLPVDRTTTHTTPTHTTPTHTTPTHTTTHPRASTTAAPAPDDEIVRVADGSSDYEHSDMAEAVDEAQHNVGRDTVKRP